MSGWVKKKTWVNTSVELVGSSFAVLLDDEYLQTPKKAKVLLPTQRLAEKLADEWQTQSENIDPSTMPYSRLVNSAIDKVQANFDSIVLDLLAYGDTDLVCYRAESPRDLVLLQQKNWDPILLWAKKNLQILNKKSPTSMAVSLVQIEKSKQLTLKDCLAMEFRICQSMMAKHDFYEGVRANLVDKDREPKWSPSDIKSITDQIINEHFNHLGDKELF